MTHSVWQTVKGFLYKKDRLYCDSCNKELKRVPFIGNHGIGYIYYKCCKLDPTPYELKLMSKKNLRYTIKNYVKEHKYD